jgi:ethanolamine-phosphate cytidylyltransferase
MLHYGHANALRQAAALGDELVVGLIPDAEILRCKGAPPVMDESERAAMVGSLKWVDEVLQGVPYDLTPEFLAELFTKHRIDLVVHGDDPCLLPDGTDAYAHAKAQGRFRVVKRTEGVSSTDLVGRALMGVRDRPGPGAAAARAKEAEELARQFSAGLARHSLEGGSGGEGGGGGGGGGAPPPSSRPPLPDLPPSTPPAAARPVPEAGTASEAPPTPTTAAALAAAAGAPTPLSRFLPTARRIVQFAAGAPSAPPGARVVYIDGAFDLFHPGHVAALAAARALGGFLLVGLHADEDVAARRGPGRPILDLHERALSVLACRYVNEVVIGAPAAISGDLLTTFNISLVVRGTVSEGRGGGGGGSGGSGGGAPGGGPPPQPPPPSSSASAVRPRPPQPPPASSDAARYAVPRSLGIFRSLPSPSPLTAAAVIDRIVSNRAAYEARNAKKAAAEAAYYAGQKTFVEEV